ncbi:unnamed protein product [Polarella glacialis]|nr:unnamed protein product [Polarella glacialis]CAE8688650.1 unnamed protein product [Polarella glacialis]
MWRYGLTPNVISYSSAISACSNSGQWESVLQLMADMKQYGLQPDAILYHSAINACRNRQQFDHANELLLQMRYDGFEPDGYTSSATIGAMKLAQSSQWLPQQWPLEDSTPIGPQGPQGSQGSQGSQGPQVPQGPLGPQGPQEMWNTHRLPIPAQCGGTSHMYPAGQQIPQPGSYAYSDSSANGNKISRHWAGNL